MTPSIAATELKRRLDAVICPICTECKPDGTCGLERVDECPIATHLDKLLYTAVIVKSDRMDPYEAAVRHDICADCRHREGGVDACHVRVEGHCALDSYLMPALEVVDEFAAEIERRRIAGSLAS